MYFPEQLAPGIILARLPMTPSVISQMKGMTDSGIITSNFVNAKSPSDSQREFYFDLRTDKNGQLQSKLPVALEVIMIPEGDETVDKLDIKVGQFWGIRTFSSIEDFGIDCDENGENWYWYFSIEPKKLGYRFSSEQFESIKKDYNQEDIFITDRNSYLSEELSKASKELSGRESSMPQATLKSPILNIGDKISTM